MSGLIINPEYAYLGASPDGIVSDPTSTNPNGLLEIKCPYQARNSTPFEAATQKGFFCKINNGTLVLKKIIITIIRFKVRWLFLQGNGVISLYIQPLA